MNQKIKKYIFSFFLILLLLPTIQTFQIIKIRQLDGAFWLTRKPEFSKDGWFSGSYQQQFTQAIEDHIGFRSWFIRFRNQLDFWLFNISHTDNVLVGKNNVLYQKIYIDSYLGKDIVDKDEVETKVNKYKVVQNELKKRNIDIVFLIAPGKVSIYPEYLPDWINIKNKKLTNYDQYIKAMQEKHVNVLDMRNYFQELKTNVGFPLFPRCGTHWSGYGITLVTDTLIKYLRKLTSIDFVNFYADSGISRNDSLRFTDDDIGKGMNLIFDIPSWKMYYPNIVFNQDKNKIKPDVLFIGDSFNQSFIGFYPYFTELFGANTRYWYYNKVISWPDSIEKKYIEVNTLNLKKEVESRRIIIIVSTEQNLNNFGFGFIDNVYALYIPDAKYRDKFASYKKSILNNNDKLKKIKIEADSMKIPIDSMILLKTIDLINYENRKIAIYENSIKSDKNWLEAVKKKAIDKKISIEEMIHLDAIWLFEHEQQ